MLEIRYNIITKLVTAWCGDDTAFGLLGRERHTVVILDIPIPNRPLGAWLFDEATQNLVDNPDYVEPKPPPVFEPPQTGIPEKVEYIEQYLKELQRR